MIITGKKFSKPEMSRVINGDIKLKQEEERPQTFRLDQLVLHLHGNYARATLQRFIKEGRVKVDGIVITKPSEHFESSANITVDFPKTEKSLPKLNIIYEDSNILVVEKPAGMLSMAKGEFCPEPTLEDYGLLVHRLDRDTSGVVILAKNPSTQSFLRRQFQDRKTKKTYYAIVAGRPKQPEALINLPIARNLKHPTTFLVDASGKPSETHYKVLNTIKKQGREISLIELKPRTGRTHQLRVHMNYLSTPILGDLVYGDKKSKILAPSRLFLHAGALEISIENPEDPTAPHIRKLFTSPLPQDFSNFFQES